VQIQSAAASTANDYGETTPTWSKVANVRAAVTTLSGREAERAQQVHPSASVEVVMRYRSDVNTAQRIKYGSRYLHPVAVIPDEREQESLTVLCEESS